MIFGINTTRDISKLSQITYNNFEISLLVFMPNITANHAITYTNPVTCGMVSPADVMSFSQKVYIAAVEPHFQPRLQTFLMFGLAMNLVD